MSKHKTAMQKLIDYMEENYHLTEESRYEFKMALKEEEKQLINFHIETMKNGLIVEAERKWEEDYEPMIKEIAENTYQYIFNNSVVS
jgi:hypothetical protein